MASWHLFHLTNHYEQSQLSITLNPSRQIIALQLPDIDGNLQKVMFRHEALFDRRWHKIMFGVSQTEATLWVDCKPVAGIRGRYVEKLEPRGFFDTDGYLFISKMVETTETVPVCNKINFILILIKLIFKVM